MSQQPILFGAGGVILGLLAGIAFSAGPGRDEIRDAVTAAVKPVQATAGETATAQQEAIAALGERIAALESAMPDTGALAERIGADMDEKMTGLGDSLSSAISDVANSQKAALDTAVSEISSGLEQSAQAAAAAMASVSTGEPTGVEGADVSEPLTVGQTAMFAEGKVRAFVSRIDPSGGAVRLVVNREQVNLGSGGSAPVSFDDKSCSIAVLGLSNEGVTLGSDCGSAMPEDGQEEQAAAGDGAGESLPPAPEDGFRPGTMANLGDGALRVFVSGVSPDGSAARIAVNGFSTQVVPSGDSIDVTANDRSCTVTVTGVGNGMVGLDGSCG